MRGARRLWRGEPGSRAQPAWPFGRGTRANSWCGVGVRRGTRGGEPLVRASRGERDAETVDTAAVDTRRSRSATAEQPSQFYEAASAASLRLRGWARPRRAEQIAQENVSLLARALVDVAHDECDRVLCVFACPV